MDEMNQPATRGDLAVLRTELKADMAALRTELKADMAGLRTELKADMAGLRAELRAEFKMDMDVLRDELKEFMRDLQTELLRAFHTYTDTAWARMSRMKADISNISAEAELRLDALERRVMDLEKRLGPSGVQ
jgi:polyhydroxyalkanoate synthesis regulator phasin